MKSIGVVVAAAFIVSVRASAAVTGFVWQDDGTPAAHARVAAYRPESWEERYVRLTSKNPARVAVARAMTDEKGAYSLDTPGRVEVAIEIDDPSFAPVSLPAIPGEPLPALLLSRVPLRRGSVTSGGKAVAGAYLVWRSSRASYETRTDANGSYGIPDPARWGASEVEVLHPDFAYARLPAVTGLRITIEPGVTIRGRAVDAAGKGAGGVALVVDSRPSGVSSADGSFTLTHVPQLYQRIVAHRGKDAGSAAHGKGDITIALAPAASLAITVRDAARHPLPGFAVAVTSKDETRWASTDQNGVATVDALSAGDTGLMPGIDGVFTFEAQEVTLRTAAPAQKEIVASRAPLITGTVRDEKGEPVGGAIILATPDPGGRIPAEMVAMFDVSAVPVAVSVADGSFIARMPGLDSLRLGAMKRGFAPSAMKVASVKGTTPKVELLLPKGLEVHGVVTADGKPLAGARIVRATSFAVVDPTRIAWAVSGADGTFSGRLNSGDASLVADADGFLPEAKTFAVSESTSPVAIALEREAMISGRVTKDDGSPAAGIFVWLEDRGSAGISAATTDDSGRFTLKARKGTALIAFGQQQRRGGGKTINVPATDVLLVMPPTSHLRGRVVDDTGAPVTSFSASVTQARPETSIESDSGVDYPITSPTGEFELDDAPAGAVKISITAEGFINTEKQFAADEVLAPVTITLVRGRTIRGRVSTPEHQPAAGATLSANESYSTTATAEDGTYELIGAPREALQVTINKTGFVPVKRSVAAGDGDVVLDVELSRGRGISGKVVDSNGKPVANASVSASSAAHDAEYQSTRSSDDGTFRLDGLAPARYDLDARTDDNLRGDLKDVDVEKARNVVITLKPRSMATITGSVAAIPAGVMVTRVQANSDDGYAGGNVDSSGNYRIENAPAGSLRVSAQAVDRDGRIRSTRITTIDVPSGATKRVDLTFAGGSTIRGRVTRGGAPLPGASVEFSGSDEMRIMVPTDVDGIYAAEGVFDGTYAVTVMSRAPSTSFNTTHVVSGDGTFDIDINIDRVAVHVIDAATSLPITEAAVSSAADGSHSSEQGVTDRNGVLQFDLTRGSANHLVISKKGYASAVADLPKSSAPAEVSLVRSEGAIVRLVDARDGRTLKGNVVARDDAGRVVANNQGETDADGTVTMGVLPGSYRFSASASSYGSQTVRATVPAGEVRIALPRGGKLVIHSKNDVHGKARLIQPDGEEYVLCWCSGIADIVINGRSTDIESVAPGSYMLEVALDGAKPQRIPVSVIEGETMRVELP